MNKPMDLNRRDFIKLTAGAGLAGLVGGCDFFRSRETPPARPNVLFVIVDDLRPELGCYGNPEIKTPNFDRFSAGAITFTRTFCQAAACAPSRASAMLGQRPETNGARALGVEFRKINPDCVTMPQHFHKFGYHTVSVGKIFHNHMPDPVSFDEPDLRPPEYATAEMIDRDPESFYYDEELNKELAQVREKRLAENPNAYAGGWAYGRSWEDSDAPDDAFYDGAQTALALDKLKELKEKHQPFYMAMGYYRPHLPFVAPRKYWDLYDRDKIPPADNPFIPENSPPMAINAMYELNGCYDLEWVQHPAREKLPEETARLLKHGYYASVSYVDACFGRLMDGLKEMGLEEDTIVVVWGDHGWKLGEHGSWCKQTNYNIDTRVPLMIRVPGKKYASGVECPQLTELVDLYPTLCDLTGIDIPGDMEGISLARMLENPAVPLKTAAFSQYHQKPRSTLDGKRYMGYSMVTERYHYVEWFTWDNDRKLRGEMVGRELYDLESDPRENISIAGFPENKELIRSLSRKLESGWRSAIIPS